MAKFIYRMQSILNVKYQLETQAKMDFATAGVRLSEEEGKLRELMATKISLEAESLRLREGILDFRAIQENELDRQFHEIKISNQKGEILKAKNALEKARVAMAEAMKERKIHETLREKAFQEFMAEENKAEGKAIDELTSYTYGQKKGDAV